MRLAVTALAILVAGGLSSVSADPADTPPAKAAQTPADAKPAPSAPTQSAMEQQLRREGYKATLVKGETMYCRREAPPGSRLASTVHCVTVAEAELIAKEARETTERLQRGMEGCLTKAMHGCGN